MFCMSFDQNLTEFEVLSSDAGRIQRETLKKILEKNGETEYLQLLRSCLVEAQQPVISFELWRFCHVLNRGVCIHGGGIATIARSLARPVNRNKALCMHQRGFPRKAKKFGAAEFVNPNNHTKPVQEIIAEMTDGRVDRSVECTGNINAMISAFEDSLQQEKKKQQL